MWRDAKLWGPRLTGHRWLIPAAIAVALAARDLGSWVTAATSGLPIAYGEGAVLHAGQILARGGDPYAQAQAGLVSANYPPLAYAIVALGLPLGPFVALRLANIVAAIAIAALIAWRARADRVIAVTLGASFLAVYPVGLWTEQHRVDLLSVALCAGAIVSLGARRRGPVLFGILGALALLAKPTAVLPLAAVVAYLLWHDRRMAIRSVAALAVALLAGIAILLLRFDPRGLVDHLAGNNAFPYDWRNPMFLLVLAALLLGAFVIPAVARADGIMRAYLAGALGVVILGGHEGATVNYLLDLAAAALLALAPVARHRSRLTPALIAGQLIATMALTISGPFAPAGPATRAERVALVSALPAGGRYYVEDSGPLLAAGLEPYVDDAYVWARLVALGKRTDDVTPLVEARAFGAIISDVPLATIGTASEIERQRWPQALVDAVLRRYVLDAATAGGYRYLPRR